MNSDLIELLQCLNEYKVRYLVIGGQAVIVHSEPRYTKDLDIWVEASKQNSKKLVEALEDFGAPTNALKADDFVRPGTLFIFGIEPNRVDILNAPKGTTFKSAYTNKKVITYEGVKVPFIGLAELIKLKRAAGRKQDKMDLEKLERSKRIEKKKK